MNSNTKLACPPYLLLTCFAMSINQSPERTLTLKRRSVPLPPARMLRAPLRSSPTSGSSTLPSSRCATSTWVLPISVRRSPPIATHPSLLSPPRDPSRRRRTPNSSSDSGRRVRARRRAPSLLRRRTSRRRGRSSAAPKERSLSWED